MNEWGIPDWTREAAYDYKRWSDRRWRWEFTRRREDYRKEFDDNVERTLMELGQRKPPTNGRFLTPGEPGFVAKTPDYQLSFKKFGLASLPNPRISNQPFHVLRFRRLYEVCMVEGYGKDIWAKDVAALHAPDGTVAVLFDLSRSIEPQWEAIKEAVLWHQQNKYGDMVSGRKHPQKWLRYLRVLDGRESGASWSTIAETAISASANVTKTSQSARQIWGQARDLMFNWPD